MKRLILAITTGVVLSSAIVLSQSRGTPSQIRVNVDANGSLVVASAMQASPVTQQLFSNARLAVDDSGNLLVVCSGCGGGGGSGTITSIATTLPISGGTITTAGTISCPTCTTGTVTANQVAVGSGANVVGGSTAFTFAGALLRNTQTTFFGVSEDDLPSYIQGWTGYTTQFTAANPVEPNVAVSILSEGSGLSVVSYGGDRIRAIDIDAITDSSHDAYGVAVAVGADGNAATGNLRGIYVLDSFISGGAIPVNQFGINIENQTHGTSNWAIKTGTGKVEFGDVVQAAGYKSSDGTAGFTGTCTILGLVSITVKNGLVTACS